MSIHRIWISMINISKYINKVKVNIVYKVANNWIKLIGCAL